MKHTLTVLAQLLLLVLPITAVCAEFNEPHITVYGTAETKAVPDRINWSLSLKNQSGTVKDAADRHAEEVSGVLSYLHESGIAHEDITTSRTYIEENYVYRNNSRVKDGYMALTSIQFETTDFATYLDYWKKLSTFNNLTINNVGFDLSNRLEIKDSTKIIALQNAREKAVNLAKVMGTRIMGVLLIEELHDGAILPRNTAMLMDAAGSSREGSPISPGKEMVRAEIKVIFRIAAAK